MSESLQARFEDVLNVHLFILPFFPPIYLFIHISLLLIVWLAERTFLRCSHETSVQVGSDVVVDDVNDSLKRMRELVDIAGGKSEGVDDASLTRFLVGFSMDVEVAAKAFAKHQEWEAFIKPRGFISETEIPNELNAKKSYLQGRDKQGRPISVILARNHFNNKDVDEFRRFIVYSMDKILASSSTDGKLNVIIDLKGLGLKNLDSKAFIEGFDIYQSHYPERIEKFYMVNAPFIFNGLWKVVSPFISEITRKKVRWPSLLINSQGELVGYKFALF